MFGTPLEAAEVFFSDEHGCILHICKPKTTRIAFINELLLLLSDFIVEECVCWSAGLILLIAPIDVL